jgi:hypothetical protein
VLAVCGRGVTPVALALPTSLGVGDRLGCFDLDIEPRASRGGGGSVGGRDMLGVGFGDLGVRVVWLGEVLETLVGITGVWGCRMAGGMRETHRRPSLRLGSWLG